MRQYILIPFFMLLSLALSCSDKDSFRNICTDIECQPGEICRDGKCYFHCQADEECDQGHICKSEICVPTICGDGLIEGEEECDFGEDNADDRICTAACKQAFCGDSLLLRFSKDKEECDDGNTDDLDDCTNDCTLPACGDGRMQTGETCMDGFSCTLDKCFNDECISTERDCSGIITSPECQTAVCDEKLGCVIKPINIGGTCNDNMACTQSDVCRPDGTCSGTIRDCSQIITDQKCQSVRCEEPVGCVIDAINIGESCDDGQLCSSNDTCQSDGSCIGESAVDCSDLITDSSCQSARCDDALGCIQVPINIGHTCEDSLFCTEQDHCNTTGTCIGNERDCSSAVTTEACQVAICDETQDQCVAQAAHIGESCSDELDCTNNDVCKADGTCVGSAISCDQVLDEPKCQAALCEEQNGCYAVPDNLGETCDDGLICNEDDQCQSDGTCRGLSEVNCTHVITDENCQSARCDEGTGCVQVPINEGLPCIDGLFCTEQDLCDAAGTCVGSQPNTCSEVITTEACQIAICDETEDRCYAQAAQVGESCNDTLNCTENDICMTDGTCKGETINCDYVLEEPQCQQSFCEEQNGCYAVAINVGDPCDDGIGNTYATVCLDDESCGGGAIRTEAFIKVSAGHNHTCGITPQYDVYCWGDNTDGALANNMLSGISLLPEKIDVSSMTGNQKFEHIEAGNQHTCGLNTNGDMYCWGTNAAGQLGLGSTTNQTLPAVVDMSSVSIGSKKFLKIETGMSDSKSNSHSCGVAVDGKVYCFGSDSFGKLGNGTSLGDQILPTEISTLGITRTFIQISAGYDHTCGITSKGEAYCWGQNSNGQLGVGSQYTGSESPKPVRMTTVQGVQTFAKITTGLEHTCALTAHGRAYCWGKNTYGCLGSLTGNDIEYLPIPVDTSNLEEHAQSFIQITAGRFHTCAISQNRKVYCFGKDDFGQIGDSGEDKAVFTPTQVDSTHMYGAPYFSYIDAGNNHTCGITVEGDMYCWGSNQTGQLGIGTQGGYMPYPESVDISNVDSPHIFKQMDAGKKHSCGLTSRGQPFCFGKHKYVEYNNPQLPNLKYLPMIDEIPVAIDTKTIVDQRAFLDIAAGGKHSCGVNALGEAYCWGVNNYGQLGIGETTVVHELPMPVDSSVIGSKLKFVDIGTGLDHSCGLTAEGKVYCWGTDECGQLGNNMEQLESLVPVQVYTLGIEENGREPQFVELSVGLNHNLAITSEGDAYCWGNNTYGECGNGDWCACEHVPVKVHTQEPGTNIDYMSGDRTFRHIAAGDNHSCVVTTDGKLYCFGDYRNGRLGNDDLDSRQVYPFLTDRANSSLESIYRHITVGGLSSCAMDSEFKTFCFGELQDDSGTNTITITSSTSPAMVSSSTTFVQLNSGQNHMCGVTDQGEARCFGADDAQQLGWGLDVDSTGTPQRVDISNL